MQVEQKGLEKKNRDLAEAYREKAKSQQQLMKLYQSLKQQQLAAGMELAADHDAEHVLRTAGVEGQRSRHSHSRADSHGSRGSGGRSRAIHEYENHIQGGRSGLQIPRQRLSTPPH